MITYWGFCAFAASPAKQEPVNASAVAPAQRNLSIIGQSSMQFEAGSVTAQIWPSLESSTVAPQLMLTSNQQNQDEMAAPPSMAAKFV
ncbi:hypothetical protein A33O_00755 [Nitratireductor aquibiodomus RA22]|uniref:Uncharacterized protein n=1 Tax=Nitratireductor aquibiodomus RA22 TaxID=1189611 RepID=I5C8W4_9HYPH|nr:hypothetical protein A33O_00755 [Nitratireductor aquibiodomus RA22]